MKVGIIGLGEIAQRVYLPILSKSDVIQLIGAFTPNKEKGKAICDAYALTFFETAESLIDAVDIVFIHAATKVHYELVNQALEKGKPVYIDKPLAFTLEEAEKLVEKAKEKNIPLMIGFNRRFAPAYRELKSRFHQPTFIHVEKHRKSISDESASISLLDDFIHVVDTLIWFVDNRLEVLNMHVCTTEEGALISVDVTAKSDEIFLLATMHRNSGTNIERVSVIDEGKYFTVNNLDEMTIESDLETLTKEYNLSDNEKRGFVEIVSYFLEAVTQQKPLLNTGEKSLKSQQMIEWIIEEKL